MPVTSKAFFRGAAATTNTTLYTAPNTSTTFVVTSILVTNTSATTATYTLNLDTVSVATSASLLGNDTIVWNVKQVVPANNPAKTITGLASTTAINFHISGVEIS